MPCRITPLAAEEGTLLRVDGRLDAESLSELEAACREVPPPLTLDLRGLLWIDDRATACLQQLIADGTRVTNASPYLALRLRSER